MHDYYNWGLFSEISIKIRTWISNLIHIKEWDVIYHPRPNFNGSFVKLLLKLGHGWVIPSHRKNCFVITYPCFNLFTKRACGSRRALSDASQWHTHLYRTQVTQPVGPTTQGDTHSWDMRLLQVDRRFSWLWLAMAASRSANESWGCSSEYGGGASWLGKPPAFDWGATGGGVGCRTAPTAAQPHWPTTWVPSLVPLPTTTDHSGLTHTAPATRKRTPSISPYTWSTGLARMS